MRTVQVFPIQSHIVFNCFLCVCVCVLGIIARDHGKNEGVEDIISVEEGVTESHIHLERYDMVTIHTAYNAYVQVSENRFYSYHYYII